VLFLAEGERFELPEDLTTLNGFQDRRLKPLGHPSEKVLRTVLVAYLSSIPATRLPRKPIKISEY
jgi:hypothetical protein